MMTKRALIPFLILSSTVSPGRLGAQRPELIADINIDRYPEESSHPGGLVASGGFVYFRATTLRYGQELFRSSGVGTPTLVRDIEPGRLSSNPHGMVAWGNGVAFGARDTGLWITDGTPAGTIELADLGQGASGPYPRHLTPAGPRLFFQVGAGRIASLWMTDGTRAGTRQVSSASVRIQPMIAIGQDVLFVGTTATTGGELWRSDSTAKGTVMLRDINPGVNSSAPRDLARLGNLVVFTATGSSGFAHYVTDGTATGTRILADTDGPLRNTRIITNRVVLGGRLYFGAANPAPNTAGLWVTDGSPSNTRKVADTGVMPRQLRVAGARVYFKATQLWSSDGTTAGTAMVPGAPTPERLVAAVSSKLMFLSSGSAGGVEPWITDGSSNGTRLLRDIWPGANGSGTTSAAATASSTLLFDAEDPTHGKELWATDGTAAGTQLAWNYRSGAKYTQASSAYAADDLGDMSLVMVPIGRTSAHCYVSDGTPAGTRKLLPATILSTLGVSLDGAAYVVRETGLGQRQLLRIDPLTLAQTVLFHGTPMEGIQLGAFLYFYANDLSNRGGLYRTDGTTVGTTLVKAVPFSIQWPMDQVRVGNEIIAILRSASSVGVWRSDGSSAGTVEITGATPGWSDFYNLFHFDGRLMVSTGQGVFRFNGTVAGSSRLPMPPWRETPVVLGGAMYSMSISIQDLTLSRTDGTPAGTTVVHKWPGVAQHPSGSLTVLGGRLFFYAEHGQAGIELWSSDGTASGTALFKDIYPGPRGQSGGGILAVGRELYFAADDGVHGHELWRCDGTVAGTQMVHDLMPGRASSGPWGLQLRRGYLWFGADDGIKGLELWRLEVGAHSHAMGYGCAARPVPPRLSGTAPRLGQALTIDVDGIDPAASAGLLALGVDIARRSYLGRGCAIHLDLRRPGFTFGFRPSLGRFQLQVQVPNLASLHGALLPLQVAVGPTANPGLGMDLSNGLLLAVRR